MGSYLPTWKKDGLSTRDAGAGPGPARNRTSLDKRVVDNPTVDNINNWHRSLISSYPNQEWNVEGDGSQHFYYHDGILGEDQYIYNMDDGVESVGAILSCPWKTS